MEYKNRLLFSREKITCFFAALLLTPLAWATDQQQSHSELHKTAEDFLATHLNSDNTTDMVIEVIALDHRVRLKSCDKSLEAFWPYEPRNYQNVSIGVRCTGKQPWKVYLQAKTKRMQMTAVINTPVGAGQKLEPAMISMKPLNVLSLKAGSLKDYRHLLGREFIKNVRAGTPLANKLLAVPILVQRNQFVQILSGSGAIKVHAEGEALVDGYLGETIKVKNKQSGKIVHATVINKNTVHVIR